MLIAAIPLAATSADAAFSSAAIVAASAWWLGVLLSRMYGTS